MANIRVINRAHDIIDNNEYGPVVEVHVKWSGRAENPKVELALSVLPYHPGVPLAPEQVRELVEKLLALYVIQEVHET